MAEGQAAQPQAGEAAGAGGAAGGPADFRLSGCWIWLVYGEGKMAPHPKWCEVRLCAVSAEQLAEGRWQ